MIFHEMFLHRSVKTKIIKTKSYLGYIIEQGQCITNKMATFNSSKFCAKFPLMYWEFLTARTLDLRFTYAIWQHIVRIILFLKRIFRVDFSMVNSRRLWIVCSAETEKWDEIMPYETVSFYFVFVSFIFVPWKSLKTMALCFELKNKGIEIYLLYWNAIHKNSAI